MAVWVAGLTDEFDSNKFGTGEVQTGRIKKLQGISIMNNFTVLDREFALRLLDEAIAIRPISGDFDWMAKYSSRYDLLLDECRRMISNGQDCKQYKTKVVSVGPLQFIPRSLDIHV